MRTTQTNLLVLVLGASVTGGDCVPPTIMADRDRLHPEARCDYEGQDTAPLWAGHKFSDGENTLYNQAHAWLAGMVT